MFLAFYLIAAEVAVMGLGLAVTYGLSVTAGHAEYWCFISYTGNRPVESCIFSFVFNFCSLAYLLVVYFRYLLVAEEYSSDDPDEKVLKGWEIRNGAGLAFGATGAVGLGMTGSFQQGHFKEAHAVGVLLMTFPTLMYVSLQTYITFTLERDRTSGRMRIFRLVVTVVASAIFLTGFNLFLIRCFRQGKTLASDLKVEILCQWTLYASLNIFFCSFIPEMKYVALRRDKIVLLQRSADQNFSSTTGSESHEKGKFRRRMKSKMFERRGRPPTSEEGRTTAVPDVGA